MCFSFQTHKFFNEIVEILLAMLQRDVPDNCRQSQQYFQVLLAYVQMVSYQLKLRSCKIFTYLISILLEIGCVRSNLLFQTYLDHI